MPYRDPDKPRGYRYTPGQMFLDTFGALLIIGFVSQSRSQTQAIFACRTASAFMLSKLPAPRGVD